MIRIWDCTLLKNLDDIKSKYTSYSCVNLAIYNVLSNLYIHKNITLYTIFKNRANRDEHENRNVLNSHLCLKFSKVSAFESF